MTNRAKQMIAKYFLTVLVLFLLSAALLLVQRISRPRSETALALVAQTALESMNAGKLTVGARVATVNAGFPGTFAFSVTKAGKPAGIAIVTMVMGNSGPCTGVFYRAADERTRFCAIAGITGIASNGAESDHWGISDRALAACERRLDAIVEKTGDER